MHNLYLQNILHSYFIVLRRPRTLSPEPDFDLHMSILSDVLERCLDPSSAKKAYAVSPITLLSIDQMLIPASHQQMLLMQSLFIIGSPGIDMGVRKLGVRLLCILVERIGRAAGLRQKLQDKLGTHLNQSNQSMKEKLMFEKMEFEWRECQILLKMFIYSVITSIRHLLKSRDSQTSRSAIEVLSQIIRVFGPIKMFLPSPTQPKSFFDSPSEHPNFYVDQQIIETRFFLDLFPLTKFSTDSEGKPFLRFFLACLYFGCQISSLIICYCFLCRASNKWRSWR